MAYVNYVAQTPFFSEKEPYTLLLTVILFISLPGYGTVHDKGKNKNTVY